MTERGQSRRRRILLTSAAFVAAGSFSWAQQAEEPAAPRFVVDVNAGVTVDTNEELVDPPEGTTTRTELGATFGFSNQTEISSLDASLFSRLEYSEGPGSDDGLDFRFPLGTLTYSRLGRDSQLDLSARYFYDRVDDDILIFLDEDLNPVDLAVDGGDLRRFTLGADLAVGISAPIGFDVGAFYDYRDYIDVTDPDLYDRTGYGADGALTFALTEVITARLTASYSRLDEFTTGDPVNVTTAYGGGFTYDIDAVTVFNADLAYTTAEETVFDVTGINNEGWAWDLGVIREVANGSVGGSLQQIVNEATIRTQVLFDRAMDLPDGSLAYSIGYSVSEEGGEDRFIGSLGYVRELPAGNITATASQQTVASDDDEDTLVTRLALLYNQDINTVSSFGVNFGLGRSEDIGGGAEDPTVRANFGVTYRHALTSDWDWVLGYEASYSLQDGDDDPATGNRLYTFVDRSFTIRP